MMWLAIAFLIYFIAFNPDAAASVFESLGGTVKDIAVGFGKFFANLADGK